ncbi:MAG: type II toxin-antitoxin system prevent-host-death family antitoxin [Candidatus Liptonbacteria bacterium]|nr:type II toxin-antitoxin system prevent-host-death family antitoxin [Candidatus Liptonbacteria bacterium]
MATRITNHTFVGLRELRENMERYVADVQRGATLTVVRRSKPIFRIAPLDAAEGRWETVVDFTKIRPGGVSLAEAIKRL